MYKFLQIAITWVIFIVITNVNGFGYSKKGMSVFIIL